MQWQYPLKDWKTLHRGSVPFGVRYPANKALGELQGKKHVGTDVLASLLTPIISPCKTFMKNSVGKEGGNTLSFVDPEFGYFHRIMHLAKFGKSGEVEVGDIVGYVGQTGVVTTPSIHYDISKSGKLELGNFDNFLDPEAFFKSLAIEEIKKNMNIRILLLVDDKITYSLDLLRSRIASVREFWSQVSAGRLNYQFDVESIKISDPKWTALNADQMGTIENNWSGFYLVPYASGFDAVVVWMHPDKWKSTGSLAYSLQEQLLGVHFIATMVPENYTDAQDRWHGRYDGSPFAGVLSHESGHMLNQRTSRGRAINTTAIHQPGMDNTHYFDFIVKDLAPMFAEIQIDQFKGWKPQDGYKRMFAYGNRPTGKKWDFSGEPEVGKVYRSTDWRMFFEYTGVGLKWKSISETDFKDAVKSGTASGQMAVQEANKIQIDILDLPTPDFIPGMIKDRLVESGSWEEKWLKLLGWSETIPTKHLQ